MFKTGAAASRVGSDGADCGVGPLSNVAGDTVARPANVASLSALGLSALGVVFGDIGTSPLYTLKTVLGLTGGTPDAATTLGVLSLVVWTLIVVTTIKYVSVAMRVDNDGEGGILALMSLLGVKRQYRPTIIAVGLFGAALIYGRGQLPAFALKNAFGQEVRSSELLANGPLVLTVFRGSW
jgi:K+ transporter